MNHDEQLGRDRAPDRYARSGRETIDLIRDSMTDDAFVAYCWGQVIRYRDRAGAKGPEAVDLEKASFYEQMALHVAAGGADPRQYREGFTGYERQHFEGRHGAPESIAGSTLAVLDHGYVRLVESWGSDARIVESARMSTGKGFLGWGSTERPGDEKLLRHLWENAHSTPFEFAGATFEVQAPLFVFREWHRHRTQSYSELSARYTQMPDLHYVPAAERVQRQSKRNKQGSGEAFSPAEAEAFRQEVAAHQRAIYNLYERHLGEGVARELARINTPVSRYSRMRASANLRNWLGFLKLRQAADAQYEIRQYADAVGLLLGKLFPRTYGLFADGGR